jgi:dienelactone hydrolase
MMDGQGEVKGLWKLLLEIPPMGLFGFASQLKQGIHRDAPIAEQNTYIPVVLSHGIAGTRSNMSCLCKELASHGMIVYSIGHGDLTALYSQKMEKRLGKSVQIGRAFNHVNLDNFNEFQARLGVRQAELNCLISEIGVIASKEMGVASLAFEHLVMMGHSIGGASSIQMASKDSRVKYIVSIDPFLQPLQQQLNDLKTRQPHCCIMNEHFTDFNPHFDGWKALCRLFSTKSQDKHALKTSLLAVPKGSSHLS